MPHVSFPKSLPKVVNSPEQKFVENPPKPALLELHRYYQELEAEYEKRATDALSQLDRVNQLLQGEASLQNKWLQKPKSKGRRRQESVKSDITAKKLPLDPDIALNQDWVMANRAKYRGRWVALLGGKLVDSDKSLDSLLIRIGNDKSLFLTVVY